MCGWTSDHICFPARNSIYRDPVGFGPCVTMSGPGTANNIQASKLVKICEPSTWPEKALELVLAVKYWTPEGPQTWNDEIICTIIRFRHRELAAINTAHLVMVWSWMCKPSHGNRFFGFKNEDYKRKYLMTIQATYNDIQDKKFLYYLPGTRPEDESSKGPKNLTKP